VTEPCQLSLDVLRRFSRAGTD